MTREEIALVTRTADVLLTAGEHVVDLFYETLFRLAPDLRPMFPADLQALKAKLIDTLATVISYASSPKLFAGYLEQLGKHHAGLGVVPEHYGPAGVALLAGLQSALGPRFTPDVRRAWTAVYGEIERAMLAETINRR